MNRPHFDAFLRTEQHSVPPRLKTWLPQARLRIIQNTALQTSFKRCNDPAFAQGFHQSCPVPGASSQDYLHKILHLGGQEHIMAGIRFKGCNTREPFVDLVARTFPLSKSNLVYAALQTIRREFALFQPRYVRIRMGEHERHLPHLRDGTPDQHYYAAPISSLQRAPKPSNHQPLRIKVAQDLSFHPRYKAAYQEFQDGADPWNQEVTPSSREDFLQCLEGGTILEAFHNGEWAGLIAARQEQDEALEGYCVYEEILAQRFRGRGLGPVLQRHLIDRLPSAQGELLFGTIHATNKASIATAERVGRQRLFTLHFLPL